MKSKRQFRSAARTAQLAIILLGAFLFILIVGGLAIVRLITKEQERFLPDYLELVGRGITTPPRDYFWFLEFIYDPVTGALDEDGLDTYAQSSAWRDLSTSLKGAVREQMIARVDLLTPAGEVIMLSDGTVPPVAERGRYKAIDSLAITTAAKERRTVQPVLPRNELARRIYMPLKNENGRVLALLRLEINPERFQGLSLLRNRLFIGFLFASALLTFLWLVLMRLVRRTIEAERSASQADRLRALGTMTAGIAHEIRNPLGILYLQIEELKAMARNTSEPERKAELVRIADDMRQETDRLKNLTAQFLTFSKTTSDSTPPVNPFPVDGCLEPLTRMWSKGLSPELRKVSYAAESPDIRVRFPEDRLRQIVLNLLRNADEALGKTKGAIDVRVARKQAFVEISVKDSGPGIPPEVLDQIFDPFFTTRPEGTGLGLSLSRAFAEAGGGSLAVRSEAGKGAEFILSLPAVG
jgi:signal transduction histidine kinase